MADHVNVDLAMLEETSRSLDHLHREFSSAADIAASSTWALGSGLLADALHDFAGNWRIHRERLLEAIDTLGKAAADSAQTFRDADNQLAHTFDKAARP